MTENTTTAEHTATRPTWISRCAAAARALICGEQMQKRRAAWMEECKDRYIWAGCTVEAAREFAVGLAEQQVEIYGQDAGQWETPADAVAEDMSYWGD